VGLDSPDEILEALLSRLRQALTFGIYVIRIGLEKSLAEIPRFPSRFMPELRQDLNSNRLRLAEVRTYSNPYLGNTMKDDLSRGLCERTPRLYCWEEAAWLEEPACSRRT
jgi:hypothetical protein